MYTVHGLPRTRTLRIMWMLEELERDYTIDPIAPRSAQAQALNPSGKVPILSDGDFVMTDSLAICSWLADRHGALTFPAGSTERAALDSLAMFILEEIETPLWTAAKHSFALPEDWRVPAVKDTTRKEFALGLSRLETRLGGGPYTTGETFTWVDIILGHCARWAVAAKFDLPAQGPVADCIARILDRPALARALARADTAG